MCSELDGGDTGYGWYLSTGGGMLIGVSHELAPKLDGASSWLTLPAVNGPACTRLRSIGPSAGKGSPCLDDQGIGLTDH